MVAQSFLGFKKSLLQGIADTSSRLSLKRIMEQFGEAWSGLHLNLKEKDVSVSKNTGTPKWMVYNGKPY